MQTDEQVDQRVQHLMKNLGLDHIADTVVGDDNLWGISGQKRRVTVGEMMLDASCSCMCCENITNGLSSTDSTQLIQKFGDACHDWVYAGFISLLQPSDEMVELFDKLLVLMSHGELAYFGPVDRNVLRQIFLGNKADDPTGDTWSLCDLVLKHSLGNSPEEEEALVRLNASSDVAKDVMTELSLLRTNAPPARERDINTILPNKKYPTIGWYQFKILLARRVKLINLKRRQNTDLSRDQNSIRDRSLEFSPKSWFRYAFLKILWLSLFENGRQQQSDRPPSNPIWKSFSFFLLPLYESHGWIIVMSHFQSHRLT